MKHKMVCGDMSPALQTVITALRADTCLTAIACQASVTSSFNTTRSITSGAVSRSWSYLQ